MTKRFRIRSVAGDPGSPEDGEAWYNSVDDLFKLRRSAATKHMITKAVITSTLTQWDPARTSNTSAWAYGKNDLYRILIWRPTEYANVKSVKVLAGVMDAGAGKEIDVAIFYDVAGVPTQIGGVNKYVRSAGTAANELLELDVTADIPASQQEIYLGFRRNPAAGAGTVTIYWATLEVIIG